MRYASIEKIGSIGLLIVFALHFLSYVYTPPSDEIVPEHYLKLLNQNWKFFFTTIYGLVIVVMACLRFYWKSYWFICTFFICRSVCLFIMISKLTGDNLYEFSTMNYVWFWLNLCITVAEVYYKYKKKKFMRLSAVVILILISFNVDAQLSTNQLKQVNTMFSTYDAGIKKKMTADSVLSAKRIASLEVRVTELEKQTAKQQTEIDNITNQLVLGFDKNYIDTTETGLLTISKPFIDYVKYIEDSLYRTSTYSKNAFASNNMNLRLQRLRIDSCSLAIQSLPPADNAALLVMINNLKTRIEALEVWADKVKRITFNL